MPLSNNPFEGEAVTHSNILGKGFHLEVDEGSVNCSIVDSSSRRYEILAASEGHPYCKRIEDFMVLDATLDRLGPPLEVDVVIYLRDKESFAFKQSIFKAKIRLKRTGVPLGIVVEPNELAGLVCTPPNSKVPHAIVVRPFNVDHLGYARKESIVSNEFSSLSDLVHPFAPWVPNIASAEAFHSADPQHFATEQFPRMIITFLETKFLEQSVFSLPADLSPYLDEFYIPMGVPTDFNHPVEDGFVGRFCISFNPSEVQWLRMANVTEDRSGIDFEKAVLVEGGLYRLLAWGNLILKSGQFLFSPDFPIRDLISRSCLPRLWQGKVQPDQPFSYDRYTQFTRDRFKEAITL